ncbi:glycogen debranching protein [Christiangramia fulva]|uniref:Glycogen debranching protein n=1 Tax=Christiangramia fulva TaxID=2126553 RepID=A0A2R3Z5T0_9FLAO|nr:amylo-alpha-1,6-glucosidase [Christiangramia fulva]AVR45572.1 glycogen debranching protein [Christiangramia fulva]
MSIFSSIKSVPDSNEAHFASIVKIAGIGEKKSPEVLKKLAKTLHIPEKKVNLIFANPGRYDVEVSWSARKRKKAFRNFLGSIQNGYGINELEHSLIYRYAIDSGFSKDQATLEIENFLGTLVTGDHYEWRDDLFSKEWLLTNGIGGYASGTISGANTRSHHGVLVASLNPPADRKVLVAKVEERIFHDGKYFDLSSNKYPGVIHPDGTQFLKSYQVNPNPKWVYSNEEWKLEKNIFMLQGSNTTLIQYINKSDIPISFEIHPLYSCSDHQMVFRENSYFDFYTEYGSKMIKTYPFYGSKAIYTFWNYGNYMEARSWYKNVLLPVNEQRGLDYVCDYYRIGFLKYTINPNEELTICFTDDDKLSGKKISDLIPQSTNDLYPENECRFYQDLLKAGDQFLVQKPESEYKSIIAGYHWFEVWGRDTMIAMRGLTIARENKIASKSILNRFFKNIDRGMIPNRFPDHHSDSIPYNTIDATLWLFVVLYEYYTKFRDLDFVNNHFSALKEILDYHIKGTRYNIHVTGEGFLYGGDVSTQLTWMDAKINGIAITPRNGCAVEINALWYNALKIYEYFASLLHSEIDNKFLELIGLFERNFTRFFTNGEGSLFDVINPGVSTDNSFRPNQIFCLSLPFSVLNFDQKEKIFKAVKEKLYTPYGLRTLSRDDSKFQGVYKGDQWQRDHAYHQGTVWPFLIYEYFRAYFQIYGENLKNKKYVLKELAPIKEHFYHDHGLYCISEIFDGLEPHHGKGCIHQAWSVAALVKLYADYQLYSIDV